MNEHGDWSNVSAAGGAVTCGAVVEPLTLNCIAVEKPWNFRRIGAVVRRAHALQRLVSQDNQW